MMTAEALFAFIRIGAVNCSRRPRLSADSEFLSSNSIGNRVLLEHPCVVVFS